ncbi:MAG: hypothetical protein FJX74_05605 [Armatimonadetes bacterium]|nr:hypothetical protein [Armatimonadota bacterium]
MPWQAPTRNLDAVEFAPLRKAVEAPFHRAHDELTAAYYDHWRHGRSAPWRGFDAQPTPGQSKALFDELHGLIDTLRMLALDARNAASAGPDARFAAAMAETEGAGPSRRERLRAHVEACRARGASLDLR